MQLKPSPPDPLSALHSAHAPLSHDTLEPVLEPLDGLLLVDTV
jgi:hypothetical protein